MTTDNLQLSVDLALDTKDFKRGISSVDKQLKENQKQFKQSSGASDKFGATIEGNTKAIEHYSKMLDGNRKKLQLQEKEFQELQKAGQKLQDKIKLIDRSTADGEKKFQRYASAIQDNIDKLSKMETSMGNTRQAIERFEQATAEAEQRINELSRSGSKINKLQSAFSNLGVDAENGASKIGELASSIPGIGGVAGKTATKFAGALGGMGISAGLLVGGVGAIGVALAGVGTKALSVSNEWKGAMRKIENATGSSKKEVEKLGDELSQLNTSAWSSGKSQDELAGAIATVKQQLGELPTDQIDKVAERAMATADTFGLDFNEVIRASDLMMTNFGISSDEAMGLIINGAQSGANAQSDLLDTLGEYSAALVDSGYTADEVTQMIINGMNNGAMSTDKLMDSIKEFGVQATESTKSFKEDGIDKLSSGTQDLYQKYLDGKTTISEVMFSAQKDLKKVDNQTDQNKIGMALFGTMWEDTGRKSVLAMGDAKNATIDSKKAVEDLSENVSENQEKWNKLKEKGRQAMQVLGEKIEPIVGDVLDLGLALFNAYDYCKKLWNTLKNSDFGKAVGNVMNVVGKLTRSALIEPQQLDYETRVTPFISDYNFPTFEPMNLETRFDTSGIGTSFESMRQTLGNLDYSGARFKAPTKPVSPIIQLSNSGDEVTHSILLQQNEILQNLVNRTNTIEAKLYLDGQQIKTRIDTIDKRKSRLAGAF
ncbi:phage tail tape measure protein [Cytobacillus oceanisediminis]|uniref:phage tail tape measure protein n=1 Tax=Cytobacillus oceanisediminis TaxID=665099 RepID=UPI001CCF0023|nr:phage tail tape measure protein [Cytobacillus oceanisediminis]MBZ9535943.1 phage tail tape measure protein [Cytobacillus oceanisediminis]